MKCHMPSTDTYCIWLVSCMLFENEIICVVPLQLVFGSCGVLQGISKGKGFVDMSTVDVETITDVSEV